MKKGMILKMKKKKKQKEQLPVATIVVLSVCIALCVVIFAVFASVKKPNKQPEGQTSVTQNSQTTSVTSEKPQTTESQASKTSRTESQTSAFSTSKAETSAAENSETKAAQTTKDASTTERAQTTTSSVPVTDRQDIALAVSGLSPVCGSTKTSKETGRKIVNPKTSSWNLLVVDKDREFPSDYEPQISEVVKGSGKYLDSRVAPYYDAMYKAGKKDGVTLTPFSAYRSYARQKTNYENLTAEYMTRYSISKKEAAVKAATVILPPGTSEHNLGLCMDICNVYDSFASSKEYAWLVENAQDYGFILRYPKGKENVTNIVYEPWHWRFVGVENAKKIKKSGLCLEEYLKSLGIEY